MIERAVRYTLHVAVVFLTAGSISCRSDSAGPGTDNGQSFLLKISVNNASGTPVSGLRISAWNLIAPAPQSKGLSKAAQPNTPLASSILPFGVGSLAKITLGVYELDGRLVASLATDRISVPGRYKTTLSIVESVPTRVFKCRLIAQDTGTGAILFRDSIYAVLWQPDATQSILGWTGPDGGFETRDTLMFPNLLALPPLGQTDATGTHVGYFTLSDSVVITITDTVTHGSQQVRSAVKKGVNTIVVVWNPASPSIIPDARPVSSAQPPRGVVTVAGPGAVWALDQNYPNPFD